MPTANDLPTLEDFLNDYLPKQINEDGIDAKEMVNELRGLGLPPETADKMDQVFQNIDAGETIAFSVFKGATMLLSMKDPKEGILESRDINGFTMQQVAEFREAFSQFDVNDKGSIATEDLGSALRSLGYNPADAEVAFTIQLYDLDEGEKRTDFTNFLFACNTTIAQALDPGQFSIDRDRTNNNNSSTGEEDDPTVDEADRTNHEAATNENAQGTKRKNIL